MKLAKWKWLGAIALVLTASTATAKADIVSGKTSRQVAVKSGAGESIRSELVSHGASAHDASEMVDRMSAEEIAYYDADSGRTQAGGFLVALLVVIALVLLIILIAKRI